MVLEQVVLVLVVTELGLEELVQEVLEPALKAYSS